MSHALLIRRRAQRELGAVPSPTFDRIRDAIRELAGREGWRIRVGDYRVLYEIDDANQIVTILHMGHRRDVYR